MNKKALIPLLFLSLSASLPALTDAAKAAGDELIAALKEDAKNLKGDDKGPRESLEVVRQYELDQQIAQTQSALTSNDPQQLGRVFEAYAGQSTSAKTKQCKDKLMEAIKAEKKEKVEAQTKELEGLIKRAQDKVQQAKSPEELDGVLGELSKKQSRDYEYGEEHSSPRHNQLLQQLPQIRQFVTLWQDYLQGIHTGDTGAAIQALRSLAAMEGGLIPRSQILEREEQLRSKMSNPADIVAGIKNLDGIQDALKAFAALQHKSRYSDSSSSDTSDLVRILNSMETVYREYLAGMPFNLEIVGRNSDPVGHSGNANLIRLKAELLMLVLPRYLGAPEDTHAKPGETVQQFFVRLAADAKARGDIKLSERIQQTQQTFAKGTSNITREASVSNYYSAGQNQLGAGQYMLAVVSLQRALKEGGDALPLKQIGQQLDSIQKEHPKEYEAGMKEFLTPTMPSYHGMPYGDGMMGPGVMYPGMRPQHMGPQGQPDAGAALTLPVPGKDNAAPAKPGEANPPKPPGKTVQPKPAPPVKSAE